MEKPVSVDAETNPQDIVRKAMRELLESDAAREFTHKKPRLLPDGSEATVRERFVYGAAGDTIRVLVREQTFEPRKEPATGDARSVMASWNQDGVSRTETSLLLLDLASQTQQQFRMEGTDGEITVWTRDKGNREPEHQRWQGGRHMELERPVGERFVRATPPESNLLLESAAELFPRLRPDPYLTVFALNNQALPRLAVRELA